MRTATIFSLCTLAASFVSAATIPRAAPELSLPSRSLEKRLLFPAPSAVGFPDPTDDPFYKTPDNIASYPKGTVIRQRATNSTFGASSDSNVAKSYQIGIATENTQKQPILGVATVLVPKKPNKDIGILSFQNFEDSVSSSCAPSWAYVANSGSPAALAANLEAPIVVGWAVNNGYYVVIPDQEGPTSSFIAGETEGKIILDSLRGIISSEKLPAKSKITFYGYSGGAHATVWATELHDSYAPELNIVGATHGGTPVDPEHLLTSLNGGPFAGFSAAGLVGVLSQHPDLYDFVYKYITEEGRQKLATLRSRGQCIQNVVLNYAFLDVFKLINYKNPLQADIAQKVLKQETLLQAKASYKISVPKFPRYLYHALEDEIVPYNDSAQYVKDQCAGGANIQFVTLPIAEHLTGEIEGILPAIDFLDKAFKGTTPPVLCGTISLLPTSSAQTLLGTKGAAQLAKLQNNKAAFQGAAGMSHNDANNADGVVTSSSAANSQASSLAESILGIN
ncbi:unnamed protein product [Parajaminaea phylloscopi]